jgi:thermitase
MQWTFKLRGKPVTMNFLEGVAAVRPAEALRSSTTRSALVRSFGGPAVDDAGVGSYGLAVSARNRKYFESSGWLFVEPATRVAKAAARRAGVADAETVQRVCVGRSTAPRVTTNLATVRLVENYPEAEAVRRMRSDDLRVERRLPFANAYEVRLPTRRPLPEVIGGLQEKTNLYLFAEPVFLEAITGRLMPGDPQFGKQWQHKNDGSNGGVAGADLHSEAAWDLTTGRGPARPVRIAVIDNGMKVNHPDLKSGVVAGGYFESDGGAGTIFVRHTAGASGFPGGDHGTFCMGMCGARMNNDKGGCGSAPEADLIAVACMNDQVGTQTTLARAVAYAANPTTEDSGASATDGADVIACSLGPNGADWDLTSVLDLAIQSAAANGRGGLGVPILWAASNGFVEIARDEVVSHSDVIAVGRSNRRDEEDGSAYGPKLELLAPGRDVYSTSSSSAGYRFSTGTSYAAPLAAGVAALVLARHPDWTRDQVRQRLRDACDKVGGVTYGPDGRHDHYGYGRLNAERAVQ